MEVLKAASGSAGGASMFKTHPDPDARIEAIRAHVKEKYGGGVPSNLSKGSPLR
jgi:hypothetical protein